MVNGDGLHKDVRIYIESFTFHTKGEIDFVNLTDKVQEIASRSGVKNGLVHVFSPHATGIIVLTEYEESLLEDIKEVLNKLIPASKAYHHPRNAHSHIRSMFLSPSKTIPLVNGEVSLGTWQSIFFIEADIHGRHRTIIVQVIGS